ncbi:MAG: hypothetical protein EBR67_11045, partial [Proteobacteria bacterium]|nr:hypothetical protein [Pseudomonadota bacterium]
MQIFQTEINDGLAEVLNSKASISYASALEPCSKSMPKYFKSIASVDDSDLYYTQSILVSTSWNKNDDIFDKNEVWGAKRSPEHKPTNIEHDESQIVGHIVANWPITQDGLLIDENTPVENLPDKYDILTASVIYRSYTIPELKDRAEALIKEIESGNKFVSMECFFGGFDYGLINKSTGEYKILARNDSTSFLTKYLRAYGGFGEHENYRIGRVLRNITFSGKGFVNKPANPDSIIFTKDSFKFLDNTEKNHGFSNMGVLDHKSNINAETEIMKEKEVASTELDCTEAKASAEAKITELSSILETSKAEFDAALAESKTQAEQLKVEFEEAAKKYNEDKEKMEASIKDLEIQLQSANETIAGYMKKEKKMMRKAALVDSGFENEQIDQIVDRFDGLDDETFAAMTEMMKEKDVASLEELIALSRESGVRLVACGM